jgi:hypothetical protein
MLWRPHLRRFELTLVALLAQASVACTSTGFDGQVYRDGDLRFRVGPIPSGWRHLDVDDSRLAFRDDRANATIAVNARCGVDGDDVPLASLTQHLFLEFTDRAELSQTNVSLDGREALRTEENAALDGVKKQYLVYVLKKNGCVYDFMHIAEGSAPESRSEFERFVRGFATLE